MTDFEWGKHGSSNSFDHVFQGADGKVTIIVESKQVEDGAIQLTKNAAGGYVQMSDDWIDTVLEKLDKNSPASKAVSEARVNGTLVKGLAGVDRDKGTLIIAHIE